MFVTRLLVRAGIYGIWLLLFSFLSFFIAVWQNPYIPLNLNNWWLFIKSTFTGSYYLYHPMASATIFKLLCITLEMVLAATIICLLLSISLVTTTIKRPRLGKGIYTFMTYFRLVPFIALPLLLNQVFNDSAGIAFLDDVNFTEASGSRLWVIISNQGVEGARISLIFNFLAIALTCSYYILPNLFVIVSQATRQVCNYNYVKAISKTWSSTRIMRVMVLHRLIPTLCKELPRVLTSFFFFVVCLEYVFGWRGIGSLLVSMLSLRERYSIEIGVCILFLGITIITTHVLFTLIGYLYDSYKYKELPYEID